MLKSIVTTATLFAVSFAIGNSATAQVTTQQVQTQTVPTQQYQIDPNMIPTPPVYNGPKLGVVAYGTGSYIEVTQTFHGSPASRLGLEPGDRILQINGRPVRSIAELQQMLQSSVYTNNGQLRVLIDNVRARHGHWGAQRYVSASTYLDGFAHLAGTYPGGFPGNGPVVTTAPVVTSQVTTQQP